MVRSSRGSSEGKEHNAFKCPNPYCMLPDCNIAMQKDSQERMKKQGGISSHFTPALAITAKKQALHDCIVIIAEEYLPLSIVEKENFCNFSRHSESTHIGVKMVKYTIYKLVEIVEENISLELKKAGRGSILHDGLTQDNTHWVALFTIYNITTHQVISKKKRKVELPTVFLLSVDPLAHIEGGEAQDELVVDFNAKNH
eukprot:15335495-Ditylum_brightwellii.AAC.1